jgi:hypothetical protein
MRYRSPEDAIDVKLRAGPKPGGRVEALTLRGGGASSFGLVARTAMGQFPDSRGSELAITYYWM